MLLNIKIIDAQNIYIDSICSLVIKSINTVCAPDYNYDSEILEDWISNKTYENFSIWISNNFSYIAVNHQNEVIGIVMMNTQGEILLNYVLPKYLNKGIGKMLLCTLERTAEENNIKELNVTSTITAKNFYIKNNFIQIGEPRSIKNIITDFPLKKNLIL